MVRRHETEEQVAVDRALEHRAENFEAIVRGRRSVRAFLDTPLPRAQIEHILEVAQWAPSNCNVQPWVSHVVSGQVLDRLREAMMAAGEQGQSAPDIPRTVDYVGVYRQRRIAAAQALFAATGVERGDDEARHRSALRNFTMFGAPHVLFLFLPRSFGLREAADCGAYAQTFMLTLAAQGLASCAQGALSHHSPLLREVLGVSPDLQCLFGISFGHEDRDHLANQVRTGREEVREAVCFHG